MLQALTFSCLHDSGCSMILGVEGCADGLETPPSARSPSLQPGKVCPWGECVSNRDTVREGTPQAGKDPLCHGEEWTSGDTCLSVTCSYNSPAYHTCKFGADLLFFKIKTQICICIFYWAWVSSRIQSFAKKKKKYQNQTKPKKPLDSIL